MYKRALLLTAATVALLSGQAFAADPNNTDITTKVTTPVATGTANSGAPGDVLIDSDGSVVVSGPTGTNPVVPAVTINSSNIVTNKGTIQFTGVSNAIGVQLDSDGGSGPISGALDDASVIDLTGAGTSKIGVLITTPTTPTGLTTTFTGVPLPNAGTPVTTNTAIDIESGATLEVQGDSSIGIELANNTSLAGDILIGGSVTVTPTTAGETTGVGGTGVELLGNMTGNFKVEPGGAIETDGPGAQGVLISGILNGAFSNYGSIEVAGTATPSTTAVNAVSGSALWIQNNITGGIYNAGGDSSSDTTTAVATISADGQGTAPTIFIAPLATATTTLVISPVIDPDVAAVPADSGFGLLNRGTISAAASNPNTSTTAIRIAGAGTAVNVMVDGGILDAGTISAAGTTSSTLTTGPIFVSAIIVDNYATVPSIVTSNESKEGIIEASVSGAGEGVATAIEINSDGVVGGGHGSVTTITNAGTIEADAETSNTSLTTLQAYGINDLAGTITTINNSGTISATATTLLNNAQVAIAVDERGNTNDVTFTSSGTVQGDVEFGSGNDTFIIAATSTTNGNKAEVSGNIDFGGTTTGDDTLTIGSATVGAPDIVTGRVQVDGLADLVNVTINKNATLDLTNDGTVNPLIPNESTNLRVNNMTVVTGATLDETVAQAFNMEAPLGGGNPTPVPIIQSPTGPGHIMIGSDVTMNVNFGSFISSASVSGSSEFILLDAPNGQLTIGSPSEIVTDIGGSKIPFLFGGAVCGYNLANFTGTTANSSAPNCADLTGVPDEEGTDSQLVLSLTPKTATQLGLTGYAAKMFPLANAALANDNALGAAVINGVTSNATAQQVYSAFAPDVTGATRAEAISLTDQGTGPVGARQRALRMYAGQDGEATLWGQEFAQRLQVGNQVAAAGYDDSGFGFVLGMDAGDPADGRYGAAFTFFSGDADEKFPRDSKTTSQWYMLTGYTDWRGKGFFFDSQINVGYGNLDGKRFFDFGDVDRVADGQRAAALLSGGATAGVAMTAGGTVIMPQISVDALTMREEGYTESNGGATDSVADDGFDLRVHQEYAQSLRAFTGVDLRQDINFGDFFLQPEARVGYRYDFVDGAEKLQAEFACATVTASATQTPCTAAPFSITGPDPARGNLVAGGSIATTTGAWSIGLSYDYLRGMGGPNGKDTISQTGTLTLLGRI